MSLAYLLGSGSVFEEEVEGCQSTKSNGSEQASTAFRLCNSLGKANVLSPSVGLWSLLRQRLPVWVHLWIFQ